MNTRNLLLCSALFLTATLSAEIPSRATDTQPLEKGVTAPDPALLTLEGDETSLNRVLQGEPTVLVFYRGSWCPYCIRHLSELQDVKADLSEMGWKLVGVSPDSPEHLREAMGKAELDYTLVSDREMHAAKAFGIAFQVQENILKKYKTYGIDLTEASGRTHHQLPVPSVFAIDADGVIQYVYTNPDYKKRLSGDDLLDALKN